MISLINEGVVVFVTTKLYFISFIKEGSVCGEGGGQHLESRMSVWGMMGIS